MTGQLRILLFIALGATVLVIMLPLVPLGVTSVSETGEAVVEWVWTRHAFPATLFDVIDRFLWPLVCGGLLVWLTGFGVKRISNASRMASIGMYVLLLSISGCWMRAVQLSAESPHRELKPLWVLYDPSASGYFFNAVFEMEDVSRFLEGYEKRMQEGDVLHIGTHPPGLFLLAYGCIQICEASPVVAGLTDTLTFPSTEEAFAFVEQNARLQRPLTASERSGLKLLNLLTFTMMVVAIVPLAWLSLMVFDRKTAWFLSCLYPLIPTLSVFFPKSDVLFPALSLMLLCFAAVGVRSNRNAIIVGSVAGLMLLLTATLSLAILPTVFAITVWITLRGWLDPKQTWFPLLLLVAAVSGMSLLVFAGVYAVFDCNLLNVFILNLKNHAGFYDQFPRTGWKWLLVNPAELAFSVGLPVLLVGLGGSLRRSDRDGRTLSASTLRLALAVTIAALWLSGKNNGEAARLWCFLTPWVLIVVGPSALRAVHAESQEQSVRRARWLAAAQALVCVMTVSRVNGFSF